MGPTSLLHTAFLDELEKIAISRHRLKIPQSRKGRRPMRVDTLLRKEKDGTLYKHALTLSHTFREPDIAEARRPKRRGDVPNKEDQDNLHEP